MSYPTVADFRLEVEDQLSATGLANLVQNPSGELGGWAWVTPVTGSTLNGSSVSTGAGVYGVPGQKLIYTSPGSTASFFYTEALPIAAGEFLAASWIAPYVNGHYRARVAWLDAAGAVISSTTQTAYAASSATRQQLAAVQAPALTVAARLRFDHYGNTSGGNAAAGQKVSLQEVTAAKAGGAPGSVRTNLVTNPSFEVDLSTWDGAGATLARISSAPGPWIGSWFCRATAAGAGNALVLQSLASQVAVVAGCSYSASAYVRSAAQTRKARIYLLWGNDTSNWDNTPSTNQVTTSTAAWTRVTRTVTAPPGATKAWVVIEFAGVAAGEIHYVDAVQLEQAAGVTSYFDGASAAGGGTTYAWTGTAHASTSTASTSDLTYVQPVPFLDIIGPTYDLNITREELNVGTLTATLLDADLDPSQAPLVRQGKRCRLLVQTPTGWEPLFTGEVAGAQVQYHLQYPEARKRARIQLTATDNASRLAATGRPNGVATIADLPAVLEGAGVPWEVNGSGNQVPSATTVSTNDAATALDQVAITRDSRAGYAWVDRFNVLRAYDPGTMPSRNRLPNPNFAVDTTGWVTLVADLLVRRASVAKVSGLPVAEVTVGGAGLRGIMTLSGTAGIPVTPDDTLAASIDMYVPGTGTVSRRAYFTWYDAAGASISGPGAPGATQTMTRNVWQTISRTATVPAGAAFARFSADIDAPAAGQVVYFRNGFVGGEDVLLLDESAYSDLEVGFDLEECINHVTLRYLRYSATKGTKEIVYGPYRNEESVRIWGVRPAEFTVHGIAETTPSLQAFADRVFLGNAAPAVRARRALVPIRTAADLPKALTDLYTSAKVSNASKALDALTRVNRIEHSIRPGAWLVDLGFVGTGSVAAPQLTPAVAGKPIIDKAAGTVTVNIAAANTTQTVNVNFPAAFAVPPAVTVNPSNSGQPTTHRWCVTSKTVNGFSFAVQRTTTGNIDYDWVAIAP